MVFLENFVYERFFDARPGWILSAKMHRKADCLQKPPVSEENLT